MAGKKENEKDKENVAEKVDAKTEKAALSKKRMLRVSFNGKELLEDKIFDTTDKEVAKRFGLFDEKREYGPLTIILGEKELLPLVEKELDGMKEGEMRKVRLSVKDAFGERKAEMIRVVPLKAFHDQKMNPVPGLVISAGNAFGKVQSVSGGRVRVDFNHPLAGREVEYEVKVEKELDDKKDFAEELFKKYYSFVPNAKKEVSGEKLIVELMEETLKNLDNINSAVKELGKGFGIEIEFKGVKKEEKALEEETKESKTKKEKKTKEEKE